jgi:ubiquinone/menaquinone biosynthesis C-methylase UbiE
MTVRSPRDVLADSYDGAATGFKGSADRHVYRRLANPLVEAVALSVDVHGGTVLDVAAGTGAVSRSFPRVVAVDVSTQQLARNRVRQRVQADGVALPFPARSFVAAVCGFGVNHVADPVALIDEMARVAPVVGVSTWRRPARPYRPKQVVDEIIERRNGRARSTAGELLDRYSDAVGSVHAITALLRAGGLEADVHSVDLEIPWPGVDRYLDYRLSMPTSAASATDRDLRDELGAALRALPQAALPWRAGIIVGVGCH